MKKNAPMSPAAVLRGLALPSDLEPSEAYTIRKILGGARINHDRAEILGHINFGRANYTRSSFTTDYWLNLQRDYDLYRLAQKLARAGDEIIDATKIDWERSDPRDVVDLGEKIKRDAAKILEHWGWK